MRILKQWAILYILLLTASGVLAQSGTVPNGDFESWGASDPDFWLTSNAPGVATPITQSSDAVDGVRSVRGEVVTFMGGNIPPLLQTSPLEGFPVSERHFVLEGWYKCSLVGGDILQFGVGMISNGNGAGGGIMQITSSASSWTPFSLPIEYIDTTIVPDRCTLRFDIYNLVIPPGAHPGSFFQIDGLSLAPVGNESNILHSQMDIFNVGLSGVISQHMPDLAATAEAADDFVVPPGHIWKVGGVRARGSYTAGGSNFQSATINIRADNNGAPGNILYTDTLTANIGPVFSVTLSEEAVLNEGRYWLNFIVNMPTAPDSSFWHWLPQQTQSGESFYWQDPQNVFDLNVLSWAPGPAAGVGGGFPDLSFAITGADSGGTVGIGDAAAREPVYFELLQNYPNPFNPSTTLYYRMERAGRVSLRILDLLGREVAGVFNGPQTAGEHRIHWQSPAGLAGGVYFYQLRIDGQTAATRKMILLK